MCARTHTYTQITKFLKDWEGSTSMVASAIRCDVLDSPLSTTKQEGSIKGWTHLQSRDLGGKGESISELRQTWAPEQEPASKQMTNQPK